MNVVSYRIEVSKKIFAKNDPVLKIIKQLFVEELEFSGDLSEAIRKEWDEITHKEIRSIKSSKYLIGTTNVNDIKIFLFSQANNNANSKKNISVEVIVFGGLGVNEIVNHSYKKIKKVLSKYWKFSRLNIAHIDGSNVYIYPFDTNKGDIYTYGLKVKATLEHPFNFTIKDYLRWALFVLALIILGMLYYDTNPTDSFDQKTNVFSARSIYVYLIYSVFGYLVTEFIIHVLTPVFAMRNEKKVVVNNLSSIVETGSGKFDDKQNRDIILHDPVED